MPLDANNNVISVGDKIIYLYNGAPGIISNITDNSAVIKIPDLDGYSVQPQGSRKVLKIVKIPEDWYKIQVKKYRYNNRTLRKPRNRSKHKTQ